MSKYIVKNCPAYENGKCWNPKSKHECCSKNDDCIIKTHLRILELGKKECTCLICTGILNDLDKQEVSK